MQKYPSILKAPKIIIFNYRAKERYRVKTGHRQQYTRLLIESILFPGKPKESKSAEEVVTPVKKSRTKPAANSKKIVEKSVKTKTPAAKPAKSKTVTAAPDKKPVKKATSTKTK